MNQAADNSNLSERRVQSCLTITLGKPCPSDANSSKLSESRHQRHESGGIAVEEGIKSFKNNEIGVDSRHRSAAALRDFPIVAPI
ncbi:hypothetical protein KDW82_16060 [Burkholderia vietnamiensis]|uniref:hypothetical protein n=1 Tax=Burkholderia vietnamiensis TaxID=60552 RepID=UPI001B9012B8|nr:hypothetical protein [Burkholderia vietnamiensis]MBR8190556.1 hypothetical protein [Burkholderia vietnamiensis]